jgi:hypothetical protein
LFDQVARHSRTDRSWLIHEEVHIAMEGHVLDDELLALMMSLQSTISKSNYL